jgi:hypothetical protein
MPAAQWSSVQGFESSHATSAAHAQLPFAGWTHEPALQVSVVQASPSSHWLSTLHSGVAAGGGCGAAVDLGPGPEIVPSKPSSTPQAASSKASAAERVEEVARLCSMRERLSMSSRRRSDQSMLD